MATFLLAAACRSAPPAVTVATLLSQMTDFEELARRPEPFYTHATASSFSRESLKGGESWFDNHDVGQYVRTETRDGRTEDVLADLTGPGTLTRVWSANPDFTNVLRFYFDGEASPRLAVPVASLFDGKLAPFGPQFSYISGTGGNLYFPLPYSRSLKITVDRRDPTKPVRLYYEVGYRKYLPGTTVETFDSRRASEYEALAARVAPSLASPHPAASPADASWLKVRLTVPPNEARSLPPVEGERAVYEWRARLVGTREDGDWNDPFRAHNALRSLLLQVSFDGEPSIAVPLGDFFGAGPGINSYENLYFTVGAGGWMTSRLLMPFRRAMALSIANAGIAPYTVELELRIAARRFTARDYHLRAQWGALSRDSWPPFDTTVLHTHGEGKLVGSVYEIANPVLVWWGEGDQKIRVDGESFPSTFGTGTEDDYGFAYGYNERFTRPYHAQTRVDGPWSGGHVSLNRWYVLDALPYQSSIRFDQEMWHWMPCRPTWSHVVYWYAKPGSPGPAVIDRSMLAPVNLGDPRRMQALEGEALAHEQTGGRAQVERLANCSGAEHLVWSGAATGDRLVVHVKAPTAGRYAVTLNLCQSRDYGRQQLFVNGRPAGPPIDGYSERLSWVHPRIGEFDLQAGDNTLTAVALRPNPNAAPGNRFGLDYVLLERR